MPRAGQPHDAQAWEAKQQHALRLLQQGYSQALVAKNACFADRLSDHTFWANQFRLLLHAAAYWLVARSGLHLAVERGGGGLAATARKPVNGR